MEDYIYKGLCHIHSIARAFEEEKAPNPYGEATILRKVKDHYIAKLPDGSYATAIFQIFAPKYCYFVDDLYGKCDKDGVLLGW